MAHLWRCNRQYHYSEELQERDSRRLHMKRRRTLGYAKDRYARKHVVRSPAQQAQHSPGILDAAGLAEKLTRGNHGGVRTDNNRPRVFPRGVFRGEASLRIGETPDVIFGALARDSSLIHMRRIHLELEPCVAQNFSAPRRSGCQYQFHFVSGRAARAERRPTRTPPSSRHRRWQSP